MSVLEIDVSDLSDLHCNQTVIIGVCYELRLDVMKICISWQNNTDHLLIEAECKKIF